MSTTLKPRRVERVINGQPTSDGAGVKLTRLLTQDLQRRLDPFLMLDNFASDDPNDYGAGFPDHPHRGFETVTYMIQGRMRHRDSAGHEGLLQNGGVQWMTAGRGVVHSELPEQEQGVMEGFQLWLNLPSGDKMREPWYRDIQSAEIPQLRTPEGVDVRVIAGESHGVAGGVQREHTEPLYLDIHWPSAGVVFEQPVPAQNNAFVCAYRGAVDVVREDGSVDRVERGRMAILANDGDVVRLRSADGAARALLIAGKPLREPIAQYGPFVMNTREQLVQAVEDFNAGRFHRQASH
jgi:redox-sensitive bicupin YhaK (pirin superfamily)